MSDIVTPHAIRAFVELGVADELVEGPLSYRELSERLSIDVRYLSRLLRFLQNQSIVTIVGDSVDLSELGKPLPIGSPDSFGAEIAYDLTTPVWSKLGDAIRSGAPSFSAVWGSSFWDYLDNHAVSRSHFSAAMRKRVQNIAPELCTLIAAHLPNPLIVDVGGGTGALLAALLRGIPGANGILYDTDATLRGAPAVLESAGVAPRCRIEAGDMRAYVPAGGDVYIFSSVLHNWDDSAVGEILASTTRAMAPSTALFIVEMLLDDIDPETASRVLALDMWMMLALGGRERTGDEYKCLLGPCGLTMKTETRIGNGFHALLAIRS